MNTLHKTNHFSDISKFKEKYKGQSIIIKYGGALAANDDVVYNIGLQCAYLKTVIGAKVVVVHGGGEQTTQALEEQGIPHSFDKLTGRRLTDEVTLKVFDETLRHLNKSNVNIMQASSQDVHFLGMAGYDFNIVKAKSIGDFTGKVSSVNKHFFESLKDDCIPVFYTACQNEERVGGEHRLNVNADEFAGFLGQSLKAIRLFMLTDTNGVLDKDKKLLSSLSTQDTKNLIANGTVTGGMIPKLRVASECANQMTSGGVVILNGTHDFSILNEILYEHGAGTLVRSPERIAATSSFNAQASTVTLPALNKYAHATLGPSFL